MENEVAITVKVKNQTKDGFDAVDRGAKTVATSVATMGSKVASSAASVISSVGAMGASMLQNAVSTVAMGAASAAATGGVNLLIGAASLLAMTVPILIGGFLALAPAILAIGGVAGASATAVAGLGLTLATLFTGLSGIGGALSAYSKQQESAGVGAGKAAKQIDTSARQIEAASRALRDAKRSEVDAARDVNRARQEEIERLQDLDLALRGQKISQAEAAQSLVEAKEKARRANLAGSEWERAEARNAVDRAQYQYDSVTEKLGDLTDEKKKATKDGVNGSDQVQAALRREREAHERTMLATQALNDAHKKTAVAAVGAAGGVDQFARAMDKLSPNARSLVLALIGIQKEFAGIKTRVQDRLLAGFAESVKDLAGVWLPKLDGLLGSIADHLNLFGKSAMKALGDSEFVKNIERAGVSTGKFIDRLRNATSSLIDAFGRLAGHSTPVFEKIGELVERIAKKFDDWIKSADESGALDSFMRDAADTLQDIYDISGLVFTIVGQVIDMFFPGSQATSNGVFDSVKDALQKVSDWLGNKDNQQRVKDFVKTVSDFMKKMVTDYIPGVIRFANAVGSVVGAVSGMARVVGRAFSLVGNWIEDVYKKSKNNQGKISKLFSGIGPALSRSLTHAWDGLKEGFRSVLNWIIYRWNNLGFTLPSFSFFGSTIGGGSISTPNVPYLATGGIAPNGMAVVGERGRELVRLPSGSSVMPHGQSEMALSSSGRGQGGQFVIRSSGRRLDDLLLEILRNAIRVEGGNVQTVIGTGS